MALPALAMSPTTGLEPPRPIGSLRAYAFLLDRCSSPSTGCSRPRVSRRTCRRPVARRPAARYGLSAVGSLACPVPAARSERQPRHSPPRYGVPRRRGLRTCAARWRLSARRFALAPVRGGGGTGPSATRGRSRRPSCARRRAAPAVSGAAAGPWSPMMLLLVVFHAMALADFTRRGVDASGASRRRPPATRYFAANPEDRHCPSACSTTRPAAGGRRQPGDPRHRPGDPLHVRAAAA